MYKSKIRKDKKQLLDMLDKQKKIDKKNIIVLWNQPVVIIPNIVDNYLPSFVLFPFCRW